MMMASARTVSSVIATVLSDANPRKIAESSAMLTGSTPGKLVSFVVHNSRSNARFCSGESTMVMLSQLLSAWSANSAAVIS
ncbi:hypothetical protein D3C87_1991270 [compost metagenome]